MKWRTTASHAQVQRWESSRHLVIKTPRYMWALIDKETKERIGEYSLRKHACAEAERREHGS